MIDHFACIFEELSNPRFNFVQYLGLPRPFAHASWRVFFYLKTFGHFFYHFYTEALQASNEIYAL
jgi:hypothetical protein